MSGLPSLLVMSALLGLGSFGVAHLPLSLAFSNTAINNLSNFGTGLLLGAALGVILPEGIEVISNGVNGRPAVPTAMIAASLLMGFSFMLSIEYLTGNDHPHGHTAHLDAFDLEVMDERAVATERDEGMSVRPGFMTFFGSGSKKATKITLGLAVHALADGFALGASALSAQSTSSSGIAQSHSELPLLIFFALLIHKAPAALALSSSLLVIPLSRSAIRKHLAVFAVSTPVGSILTYLLLSAVGSGSSSAWTGQTLLFSAGTFLYVATVLQPISSHESASSQESRKVRELLLIICGMFLPLGINLLLEHDHGVPTGREIPGGIVVS